MNTSLIAPPESARVDAIVPRDSLGIDTRCGIGRRVAVLAAHHVRIGGHNYTGGAEKHVLTAIQALLESGAEVRVGYSGHHIYDEMLSHSATARLTLERTDWLNDALSGDARLRPATILSRRRWFKQHRVDTVYIVQQAGGAAFAASIVAAKSLGLRVVSSIRQEPRPLPLPQPRRWFGLIPSPQLWRRRLVWRKRIAAACCDAIVFNSARVAKAFCREFAWPADTFRVIPNGEWPHPPRAFDTRGGAHHIISVGRVTIAKGADLLLDAFRLLAGDFPEATLTYFGDGQMVAPLMRRAGQCGLNDRVQFAGYQSNRDVIFRDADIVAQLSRRESLSNSVIEAMARGLPCVVTDVGGMPEAVVDGQTGFVVSPEHPVAAAHVLRQLLEDRRLWTRMGLAASRRCRDQFDVRVLAGRLVSVILGKEETPPRGFEPRFSA